MISLIIFPSKKNYTWPRLKPKDSLRRWRPNYSRSSAPRRCPPPHKNHLRPIRGVESARPDLREANGEIQEPQQSHLHTRPHPRVQLHPAVRLPGFRQPPLPARPPQSRRRRLPPQVPPHLPHFKPPRQAPALLFPHSGSPPNRPPRIGGDTENPAARHNPIGEALIDLHWAYIGPYEEMGAVGTNRTKNRTMRTEKRAVGVVHEFLSLTVEKMVEVEKISHFRKWFGIDLNARDLFLDHPGMFYLSTKGKVHSVFLREAYERGCLIEPNPVYEARRKLLGLVALGRRGLDRRGDRSWRVDDREEDEVDSIG